MTLVLGASAWLRDLLAAGELGPWEGPPLALDTRPRCRGSRSPRCQGIRFLGSLGPAPCLSSLLPKDLWILTFKT